jgi:V8-like Glu-specific endopeptidase
MCVDFRRLLPAVAAFLGLAVLVASSAHQEARAGQAASGHSFAADGRFPSREPGVFASPERPVEVTGATILGDDERVRIDDTSAFPWRAITWLGLFDESGQPAGHCTGTFIGPDALLTAAHCLWSADTGTWTRNIAVVPGKSGDQEPFGFEWASNWWVPDAYISSGGSNLWDWGVIKLRSDSLGQTVGWLQVAQLTTTTLARIDFEPAIVGYPADKEGDEAGTMWGGIKDEFLGVASRELYHEIDTFPGESGSAIFSANTSDPAIFGLIVGVHTTGGTAYNRGSRIDAELLDDILEGCRVMSCTIAYVVEPGSGADPGDPPVPPPAAEPTPPSELPPRPFKVFAPEVGADR